MTCIPGCGACCIAISISSPIPGMPDGKPAGVRCIHLAEDYKCALFESPDRPRICHDFMPEPEMCGNGRKAALAFIEDLERKTQ